MRSILKRGELSLQFLCFDSVRDYFANAKDFERENSPLQRGNSQILTKNNSNLVRDKDFESKMKVALMYQQFLYKCLELSIEHLAKKA